jgi:hypothetical protein
MLREFQGWNWDSLERKYLVKTLEMASDFHRDQIDDKLGLADNLDVNDPGELLHSSSTKNQIQIKFYICYSEIWDCPELYFEGIFVETNTRLTLDQVIQNLKIPLSSVSLLQQKVDFLKLPDRLKNFYFNLHIGTSVSKISGICCSFVPYSRNHPGTAA